uniref:F-box domain-containing protein n=1 Tax=Leersia perrieri TaxID=77586 RepID=A0A0D9W451_9ORYZ
MAIPNDLLISEVLARLPFRVPLMARRRVARRHLDLSSSRAERTPSVLVVQTRVDPDHEAAAPEDVISFHRVRPSPGRRHSTVVDVELMQE